MIVANLATYPPRRATLIEVARRIAPQVDRLNIVLNEYPAVIDDLAELSNVHQILPDRDLKDVGKFLPDVTGADHVILLDDDIHYPPDYVAKSVAALEALGPGGFIGGYHGSLYLRRGFHLRKPGLLFSYDPKRIAQYRKVVQFYKELPAPLVVDQLGSGVCVMRGADMPPFSYMETSQQFVDVRLARWCFENDILPVCLPRQAQWIRRIRYEETICRTFTNTDPSHVADEIWQYAFKVSRRGETLKYAST